MFNRILAILGVSALIATPTILSPAPLMDDGVSVEISIEGRFTGTD